MEKVAKAKAKDFSLSISPDDVMYTSISKSKSGYNTAHVSVKQGDNRYLSVSYEWQGDDVPDFAMDLMSFMQRNSDKVKASEKAHTDEYAMHIKRHCAKLYSIEKALNK